MHISVIFPYNFNFQINSKYIYCSYESGAHQKTFDIDLISELFVKV